MNLIQMRISLCSLKKSTPCEGKSFVLVQTISPYCINKAVNGPPLVIVVNSLAILKTSVEMFSSGGVKCSQDDLYFTPHSLLAALDYLLFHARIKHKSWETKHWMINLMLFFADYYDNDDNIFIGIFISIEIMSTLWTL